MIILEDKTMKSIKRAAPWGAIRNILIIIFIAIIVILITNTTTTKEAEISNPITTEESQVDETVAQEEPQKQVETPQTPTQPSETVPIPESKSEPVQTTDGYINLGSFKISAYCHCSKCCGKSNGITATGTEVTANRTIAVDPNVIPLGSKVIIDGHTYVAEDTGGAIKGNKIDMYFATHQEALNWGIQYREVSLITQ